MLTQSEYTNISQGWDEAILDCCKTTTTGQPCGDCCYDNWQTELNKVNPAYNEAVEKASQLQKQVDFITGRRDKYKAWIEELEKAEKLARDICDQLKLIGVQSNKIWYNSCKAEKAIEILFCMLRDIYMQVDELKAMYDSLQNCIARNNDPAMNKGQGILKYLDEYKVKLDAAVKTRDDVIKNIVMAIQLSKLLRNAVFTRNCDEEPEYNPCQKDEAPCIKVEGTVYYGLKEVICEWYREFACDIQCNGNAEPETGGSYEQQQTNEGGGGMEQSEDCELIPIFDFPICNNSFKGQIQTWLDADNTLLSDLLVQLNDAKAKQQSLLACKNSLDMAIKVVDPATRCK